jgi:hypothetical protein
MIRMRSRSSRRIEPTKRSAIALARGACTGVLMTLMSMAVKTVSKAALNFAVAVADEEPESSTGVLEVHEQVAGLFGEPGCGGVSGDAQDVHAAGGVLEDEEDVESVQADRVEVEQVAGEDAVGLRSQELRPGRSGPAWRRVDPGGVQDLPDRGGPDLVAESGEFAVNAAVSPRRVLGSQA